MTKIIAIIIFCIILTNFVQKSASGTIEPQRRIINGVMATDLSFIVSIHVTLRGDEIRICVGSIISQFFVLTSATCLHGLPDDNWTGFVRAGTFDLAHGGVTHAFVKMLPHPEYNFTTRENDLLMLEVSQSITFTDFVQQGHIDFSLIRGGARVAIVGWGATNPDDLNTPSDTLMTMSDVTLNTLECNAKINNQNLSIGFHWEDSMCIKGLPDGGMCNFDYGAPLIHENKIVGVWSWGPPMCNGDYPYVFTRVAPHINWIGKYRGRTVGKRGRKAYKTDRTAFKTSMASHKRRGTSLQKSKTTPKQNKRVHKKSRPEIGKSTKSNIKKRTKSIRTNTIIM